MFSKQIFIFAKKYILLYKKIITSLLLLVTTVVLAQVGSVTISVFDEFSKKPLSANVSIQGGKDEIFIGNGSVLIPEIPSGNYNFSRRL